MKSRLSFLPQLALVLAFAELAVAAEPSKASPPAAPQSPAELAVRKAAADFDQAFNLSDAEKVAALWTVDAEYVDEDGHRFAGRDTIQKEYAQFFAANPQSKIVSVIDSVRVVSSTTAIEDGRAVIEPAPLGAPGSSRYSAVYVLQDGKWLLSSVHDIRVGKTSNYHRLDDFEWLIGTWQGGEGSIQFESKCRWLGNKSFIERTYRVIDAGLPAALGTQIIGWDPEQQAIRSWDFSADGGFAEGIWRPQAGGWSTQSRGMLGDGTKTAAINSVHRLDNDTLAHRSTDRTAGGVRLPDLEETTIKRVTTKP